MCFSFTVIVIIIIIIVLLKIRCHKIKIERYYFEMEKPEKYTNKCIIIE